MSLLRRRFFRDQRLHPSGEEAAARWRRNLAGALLLYQHSTVRLSDLSRVNTAFCAANGGLGVALFLFGAVGILLGKKEEGRISKMVGRLTSIFVAMAAAGLCVSWAGAQKLPSKAEQGFDENGKVVNLNKWFATLPVRLNKDKAEGFKALYEFKVSGPKGGHWWVRVTNQKAYVAAKAPKDKPTCIARVSDQNWLKIINGELNATFAYLTRRLRVEGNRDHANKFSELFFPP